jgi:hypothetical protein
MLQATTLMHGVVRQIIYQIAKKKTPTYKNACKPEEVDSREGNSIPAK